MSGLPWSLEFSLETPGLELSSTFEVSSGVLDLSVRNVTGIDLRPGHVRLRAELDLLAVSGAASLHGRYMQMDTLTHAFGEDVDPSYQGDTVRAGAPGRRYISREVIGLSVPARSPAVLVLGSIRCDRFFTNVEIDLDAAGNILETLTIDFDIEQVAIAAGESLALPPLFAGEGASLVTLFDDYAIAVANENGARVPANPPTGWCSWYFFYDRVTEQDVVANVEYMRDAGHPADVVQVDDGYQSCTGDWLTPNEKFPSGMAALSERIRAAGFRPGLWLAPFVMRLDSRVLAEHPEFALAGADGARVEVETWLGRCAVLDCSHPGARAWLADVIRTVVHEWGYSYLKLDALAFAAQPGDRARYHDPSFTAPRNIREGLSIIREAAGENAFILGCTCHFTPAVGVVDAMRVGPDVRATWFDGTRPSVKHAMRMTLQRNYMHGRWWANDPDCLIVREDESELNAAETRFLATAIALSGGMVVASDDLPALSPGRRVMAEALFPPPGVAAVPYDELEAPVPSAWRAELEDGHALVGILNWTDESRWVHPDDYLQPGEHAFEAWRGQSLGFGDILVEPHDATLWQVAAPTKDPVVVGDTGNIGFDRLYRRAVSGRLQVGNDLDRPRTVAVWHRGRVTEATLEPGERRWFD